MPLSRMGRVFGLRDRRARRRSESAATRENDRSGIDRDNHLVWSISRGAAMPAGNRGWSNSSDVPLGLYEPLRAGGLINIPGGDLDSVLEAFAECHRPIYRFGRTELLARMRSRGGSGFLITPSGIAVSHPRFPLILPVREPCLMICLADEPILLGPGAESAATAFVTLISPRIGTHFAIVSLLTRLLASERFVGLLDGCQTHESIMDQVWLHDCGLAEEEIDIPAGFF